MRLFLGLEIPEELKREIDQFLKPLHTSEKGWEKASDYHQTLLFLGETSAEELEVIKNRLRHFFFHSFDLRTSSFEFFNRRILYLSFLESRDLIDLKTKIDLVFPEWIRPDEKPFIPHLTVKRWQRYEYDLLYEGIKSRVFPSIKFKVGGLALFKSEIDLENNKYHVIFRVNFS